MLQVLSRMSLDSKYTLSYVFVSTEMNADLSIKITHWKKCDIGLVIS